MNTSKTNLSLKAFVYRESCEEFGFGFLRNCAEKTIQMCAWSGQAANTTYLCWRLRRSRQNWLIVRRVRREVTVVSRRRTRHHVTRVSWVSWVTRVSRMSWMSWVSRVTRVWPHAHDRGRDHGVRRWRTSHRMAVWWRLWHSSLGCPG